MITWKRGAFAAAVMAAGLCLNSATPAFADDHDYYHRDGVDLRSLIDRTQDDLRAAADLEHGNKQHDRYKNAQDHLSDFDRSLSKGKFNKDRLDTAINDLKNLLDHNTLQASTRDALQRDVEELRSAREHRGH